ncbi:helix-turn-helix domain-containing protein [Nocardiopsis sp. EMB25]|uniref:helix-turn-helix domain-containing protein n=1 Tax=Nocardiopsis sp. EMB25 TaxID=2835867 RepID=UPI002284575D|nr:helix-turn-helix transcriptional regulator [Nocardiopsis sp. EMB25]MCY9784954.1 helix-turn-helix domain-containing protein [Nocardiopsis sp. EMB25]
MPAKKPTRTLRMRRLAAELRRLRDSADLTREDVTEATRINGSTLYRIEYAQARPQLRTLHTLCDLYKVSDDKRDELLALTKNSGQQGWLETYPSELPTEYTNYILFESEARTIRNYESLFVPGLLQTEDYARAVVRGTLPLATDDQVEDRVRARVKRQELLHRSDPLRLRAVVDEAVLHRTVGGPRVMREQLLHLATMAKLPHIELQVIRFGAGAHPGMPGSFVLIDFPDPADPAVVYIDSMAGDLFLEGEVDIDRYSLMMEQLVGLADSPDSSRKLVASMAAGMMEKDKEAAE